MGREQVLQVKPIKIRKLDYPVLINLENKRKGLPGEIIGYSLIRHSTL